MSKNRADKMIAEAAEMVAVRFVEEYEWAKEFCESPIEELLLAALMAEGAVGGLTDVVFLGSADFSDRHVQQETAYVHQQAEIGQYRADFLIHDCSLPFELGKPRLMVVECDGHEFHERTKEQARRDKQRDRYFQSIGMKVLRFTGSEIFASPEKCAEEILGELASEDSWRKRPDKG